MNERTSSSRDLESGVPPERFADDEFFRALAAQPRRHALSYLLTAEQGTVEELVDVLAGWETADTHMVPPGRAEQLKIELFHVHLPILEQARLITYDSDAQTVTLEPLADPVKELIQQSVQAEHV